MLQIKNVTVTHKKDLRVLIKDFSFVLNPGDKAVMIGEEGNGKSTLLKLIAGKEADSYVQYTGDILTKGIRIGYLPQELDRRDQEKSVYEFFSGEEAFFDLSSGEMALLGVRLGVKPEQYYSQQRMGTLSGGEKVKMQLLRLQMARPDVYLLDEPSNDIDLESLRWLENFIREAKEPVLFVSHDETLIERTASVIIHLEQVRKKTVPRHSISRMCYRDYIEAREELSARQEQLHRKEKSEQEKKEERYRQIYSKVEAHQAGVSRQNPHGGQLLKKKMHAVKAMGRRMEREKEEMTRMPEKEEAMGISFHPRTEVPNGKNVLDFHADQLTAGDKVLARDVHLRVDGPQKVAVIGRNGVGKSTFLKMAAAELKKRTDLQVSYMPQTYEDLLDRNQTPVEFLSRTGDKEELTRIRTWLGTMKYTRDEMEHSAGELSGGQKAKLLLLKMSLEDSCVLVLDEPTRNFSPLSNPVIRASLKEFPGAILSISHDRKYIREVCDTVYELTEAGFRRVWDLEELE